jgi:hypothetical protein
VRSIQFTQNLALENAWHWEPSSIDAIFLLKNRDIPFPSISVFDFQKVDSPVWVPGTLVASGSGQSLSVEDQQDSTW